MYRNKLRLGAEEEIYSFDMAILISKPIIPESKIIDVLEVSRTGIYIRETYLPVRLGESQGL